MQCRLWAKRLTFSLGFQCLVILFTPCYSKAADAPRPKRIVTVEGIIEYQLDNGMRILLFPDPSTSAVTVNLTVLVGSRHEGYARA